MKTVRPQWCCCSPIHSNLHSFTLNKILSDPTPPDTPEVPRALDPEKASARVDRDYLLYTPKWFGFSQRFRSWIKGCLSRSSCWFVCWLNHRQVQDELRLLSERNREGFLSIKYPCANDVLLYLSDLWIIIKNVHLWDKVGKMFSYGVNLQKRKERVDERLISTHSPLELIIIN